MFNPASGGLSWKRRFDDTIVLPDGHRLGTLLHAATCAPKFQTTKRTLAKGQAAIESLMLVAEFRGPTMFRAHRRHESLEPSRRRCVRPVAQGKARSTSTQRDVEVRGDIPSRSYKR